METNKNKKLKKLTRQRMADTGQCYTAARASLLGAGQSTPKRSFEAVMVEVIRLADEALAEDDQKTSLLMPLSSTRYRRQKDPAEQALDEYLSSLSYNELRKVEVLMYAGRGDADIASLEVDLHRDSHSITVSVITGKLLALPEYLRKGLQQAFIEGVDLDSTWVSPSEPFAD